MRSGDGLGNILRFLLPPHLITTKFLVFLLYCSVPCSFGFNHYTFPYFVWLFVVSDSLFSLSSILLTFSLRFALVPLAVCAFFTVLFSFICFPPLTHAIMFPFLSNFVIYGSFPRVSDRNCSRYMQ